ncbi:DUF4148 domain-containing protein [Paraburkholderia sabiae]|uniref:DUF4148 domain-containing protein n=1 Tax=Paraburkholderia sabiae TaxID=273251 RepID=UPI001919FEB3
MNTLRCSLIVISCFASATAFAQSVTRAQVQEELRQVEEAGFSPTDGSNYPANLRKAERKVAEANRTRTSVGGSNPGSSDAGVSK